MSGREPVRPHDAGKERNDDGREMCEIDEEDEDLFGYKATEHGRKHELKRVKRMKGRHTWLITLHVSW